MPLPANIVAAALLALASSTHAATGYVTVGDGEPVTDSFGACVHTGDWKPGMRFANCEPHPVRASAAAPAPKPAAPVHQAQTPARPAPRPAPFKVSADTLFEFDSATLTPAGRVALDALERRIAGARYDSVTVTGHTDRLGEPSYNQRLSERRAGAVRAYLAHGLDISRISAKGVGSAQPMTAPGACDATRDAGLIQCLQPDRYAEVAVVATAAAASLQ